MILRIASAASLFALVRLGTETAFEAFVRAKAPEAQGGPIIHL